MLGISLLPHAINQYAFIKITHLKLYAFFSSPPIFLTEFKKSHTNFLNQNLKILN